MGVVRGLDEEHGIRAHTLVPDLAFIGLMRDAIDASDAALDLARSERPYRAYAMARVCFEAAQRILPLGVFDDYMRMGTLAWVYYQKKDAALGATPDGGLGDAADQIVELWEAHNPAARALVDEALHVLRKRRRPDNFLGRNLAEVAHECYEILATVKGSEVPTDSKDVNHAAYAALSRDTHAAVRLQPKGIHIDADGWVEVEVREREASEIREAVQLALTAPLREIVAAVRYRLAARRKTDAEQLADQLSRAPSARSTEPLPDLGRVLLTEGLGHTQCVFPDVPLKFIRQLPDGTLSSSLAHGSGSEKRLATFDFKGKAARRLRERLSRDFPDVGFHDRGGLMALDLPTPEVLTIRATLGKVQHTGEETFVPFVVDGFD